MKNRNSLAFASLGVITIFLLWSCKPQHNLYYEAKDKDLIVQLTIEKSREDNEDKVFKVRILPSKELGKGLGVDKNNFYYHMDSCFYLNSKKGKIYALLVEPIANGVNKSYEYLLNFSSYGNEALDFVYQDKFLNKRAYKIRLN